METYQIFYFKNAKGNCMFVDLHSRRNINKGLYINYLEDIETRSEYVLQGLGLLS